MYIFFFFFIGVLPNKPLFYFFKGDGHGVEVGVESYSRGKECSETVSFGVHKDKTPNKAEAIAHT